MSKILVLNFVLFFTFGLGDVPQNRRKIFNPINYGDDCKLSAYPPAPHTQCCGVDMSSSNRIVGGEPTGLYQYPWVALMEYKFRNSDRINQGCGATLISGRYVLTAGHCVTGDILKTRIPSNVILGEYDRTNPGRDCVVVQGEKHCAAPALRIPISKIIPHEHYDNLNLDNDIALVRLSKLAPYTATIRPICLPQRDFTLSEHRNIGLYVSGWGVMTQIKNGNKFDNTVSAVKRHVQVPYVPLKQCQAVLPSTGPKQVCAGGVRGKDSCFGDSGGPLMFENNGVFEQVGVVSFGISNQCGESDVPSVYTHVSKYLDWVRKNIVKYK